MGKYIVEVKDGETLYKAVIAPDGEPYITPAMGNVYTEPDTEAAYAHGYSNAEIKYRAEVKEAYQKGLEDAWDAARKVAYYWIWSGQTSEAEEIFGTDDVIAIFKSHSASEAIEKIRQYERGKEEQIQVGDEVISPNGKGVVTEIKDIYVRIMYAKGSGQVVKPEDLTKTGRHFPEIAEVLEKMKGSQ